MDRVMIIGQPGSGKSTLAQAVGAGWGLPVVHMDKIHWKSGWVERSRAEKLELIAAEEARPRWVIEGGLSATYDTRLARADLLIWLDRDWPLRLARVLRRSWRYRGMVRPDLAEGCPEQFGAGTLEFVGYIWRTRRSGRAVLSRLGQAARAAGTPVVHLASDAAAVAWLVSEGLAVPEAWER